MYIINAFSYVRRDGQIILFPAEHMIPEQERKGGRLPTQTRRREGAAFIPF